MAPRAVNLPPENMQTDGLSAQISTASSNSTFRPWFAPAGRACQSEPG